MSRPLLISILAILTLSRSAGAFAEPRTGGPTCDFRSLSLGPTYDQEPGIGFRFRFYQDLREHVPPQGFEILRADAPDYCTPDPVLSDFAVISSTDSSPVVVRHAEKDRLFFYTARIRGCPASVAETWVADDTFSAVPSPPELVSADAVAPGAVRLTYRITDARTAGLGFVRFRDGDPSSSPARSPLQLSHCPVGQVIQFTDYGENGSPKTGGQIPAGRYTYKLWAVNGGSPQGFYNGVYSNGLSVVVPTPAPKPTSAPGRPLSLDEMAPGNAYPSRLPTALNGSTNMLLSINFGSAMVSYRRDIISGLIQRTSSADDLLCIFESARRGGATNTSSPVRLPFVTNELVSMAIDSDPGMMTRESLEALANSVGVAFAVWRRACQQCAIGNASMLLINDSLFVDSQLHQALSRYDLTTIIPERSSPSLKPPWARAEPPIKAGSKPPLDYLPLVNALDLRGRGWRGATQAHYELVAPDDEGRRNLCAVSPQGLPPLLQDVRAAFACEGNPRTTKRNLKIKVLDRNTSCGLSPNIVGCCEANYLLELNAKDYAYTNTTGQVVMGHGNDLVSLTSVLVHEMGHWIGVGHIAEPGNIMADSALYARCINNTVVDAVSAALSGESAAPTQSPFLYRPADVNLHEPGELVH